MEPQLYKILFEGEVVEGVDRETAKSNLQRLFKTSAATVEKLFSGKRVVIKKDISASEAKKYQAALNKAGIQYKTEPEIISSPKVTLPKFETSEPAKEDSSTQPVPQPHDKNSSNDSHDPYAPPTQSTVVSKQVFCRSCGEKISETDRVCPACNGKQLIGKPKSKITAALLALFLGFLGAHRFYLGQWRGLIYLFFGILAWPIAIIEAIVFLLTDKDRWNEKYGNVAGRSGVGFIIIILGSVAIIGIIAAVALPAYQDYVQRAKVAEAMETVQSTIEKVEEFIKREKFYPTSNHEAGLADNITGDRVKSILLSKEGVLTATLSGKKGNPLNGQTLVWVPRLEGNSVQWDCSGGTLPGKYRPEQCRIGKFSSQQASVVSHWVASEDNLTKINLPKSWKQIPELSEEASIKYGNAYREQYMVVMSEPKEDFSSATDLQAYNEILLEQNYRPNINNLSINSMDEVSFNDLKGLKYEIRGEVGNVKIVYLLTILEGENHFHQVLFWTLPTKWRSSKDVYEAALTTFAECNGGCRNL
jgi:Tfp pilus assembly major pilin PilA/TM2 domain-containing membrane protein YozV